MRFVQGKWKVLLFNLLLLCCKIGAFLPHAGFLGQRYANSQSPFEYRVAKDPSTESVPLGFADQSKNKKTKQKSEVTEKSESENVARKETPEKKDEVKITIKAEKGHAEPPEVSAETAPEKALLLEDEKFMKIAIAEVETCGGERAPTSSYPNPTIGAVLVSKEGDILAKTCSDYQSDAVVQVLRAMGLSVTPLAEWYIEWPSQQHHEKLESATLYLTMEPNAQSGGTAQPSITKLIALSGVPRVVIGCPDPVAAENGGRASTALHASGISVRLGVLAEECKSKLYPEYTALVHSKLRRMARKHFAMFQRPLGFLHCSVVDSNDIEAFARHGNAFGKTFNGKNLGQRYFGAYEIAPPPQVIWADEEDEEDDFDFTEADFEDEEYQEEWLAPMMPWYEQADAVVATLPRSGGPNEQSRFNGLKWLATHGRDLPAGVERILVMDATDIRELPLQGTSKSNRSALISAEDLETFWKGTNRRPTRILLRRGTDAQARALAQRAASAAEAAAEAAKAALNAVETGDAWNHTEIVQEHQRSAMHAADELEEQLRSAQRRREKLQEMGVIVETIEGNDPIDVLNHLGKRNGLHTVVWRAGCWGQTGVKAIMDGAFQWVSAHLAVDAVGGKFWQNMLAENAVQAACGAERKVKIFSDQDDLSLEYCDQDEADSDCSMSVDGRPVRHVRLDCRVALVDEDRPREFRPAKTARMSKRFIEEQAPWFL